MMNLFKAYSEWIASEFETETTLEYFTSNSMLPIAYTTYGDYEEYEIQISYDYENQYLHNEVYGFNGQNYIYVDIIEDYNIEEMIENFECTFDEMIYSAVHYLAHNELI